MSVYSDLEPQNFELFYSKILKGRIGYLVGLNSFLFEYRAIPEPNRLAPFANLQPQIFSYAENASIRQNIVYWAPFFLKNWRYGQIELSMHTGLAFNGNFAKSYFYTRQNSFEPVKIKITGKRTPHFYYGPDIKIIGTPMHFKKARLGLFLQAAYQTFSSSLNYSRKVYRWTADDYTEQTIKAPKHKVHNLNAIVGINITF